MCKLGDIIIVKEFKDRDREIVPKHSFVVINDEEDYVEGLKYDFVANVMCSFHNRNHKKKKLKYIENFPILDGGIIGENINSKEGYVKADQLYYFDKKIIEYQVIAHMEAELLDELVQLILFLNEKGLLKNVLTNLQSN